MSQSRVLVIDAAASSAGASIAEVWSARELMYFLVWRDLKVRYKQTALGALWAIIQPFATMVVFSLFFGRLVGVPSDGVPYPVFSFAALVPWTYFSAVLAGGAQSLVGSQGLISKVYFPRLVIPMASVATPLVDAGIAMLVLLVLMGWFGIVPPPAVALLPLYAGLAVATAAAAAVWLSALSARYRDVRYVVPFLAQFWLFVTPVAYPTSLVPERWRVVYGLNPMATVVDGFRWCLLDGPPPAPAMTAVSCAAVAIALWTGVRYFQSSEATLADRL
jgi:lipopolysaccharide transport system permease protein